MHLESQGLGEHGGLQGENGGHQPSASPVPLAIYTYTPTLELEGGALWPTKTALKLRGTGPAPPRRGPSLLPDFSTAAAPFYIKPSKVQGCQSLHIPTSSPTSIILFSFFIRTI